MLSVSHITGVTPRSEKNVTMFMAESNVGHKRCREKDLVINTMWAWMGALGVSRYSGLVSPSYGVYRPLSDKTDPLFLDALLRTSTYVVRGVELPELDDAEEVSDVEGEELEDSEELEAVEESADAD